MSVEAGYTPNGEQFAEGSGVNPFDFLVGNQPRQEEGESQERGIQLAHPFEPFALMDMVTQKYLGYRVDDLGFYPTEEQYQLVNHVKLAYGIIAHPFCEETLPTGEKSPIYQKEIELQVAMDRVCEGNNRVALTDEEREILVKVAKAGGIPCDPEKSEYFYNEIPRMTLPEEGMIGTPTVVDAETS